MKEILIVQEAKKSGMDLSDEVRQQVESFGQYPSSGVETEQADEIRELAERQAEEFNMDPEEVFIKRQELHIETSVYVNAFIMQKFGEPPKGADLKDLENFDEKIDEWLDQLIEKNQEEIEIYID